MKTHETEYCLRADDNYHTIESWMGIRTYLSYPASCLIDTEVKAGDIRIKSRTQLYGKQRIYV